MSRRLLLASALLLLSACGSAPAPEQTPAQIANPASAYCVSQGGTLEIVTNADGQVGMCHLPDGSVVEEWELYRSANP